jgi:hypothetical protein
MNKLFKATWGDGYAYPDSRVITLDDITEENGWWEENVIAIQELQVGSIVDCSDMSGVLHVERVK